MPNNFKKQKLSKKALDEFALKYTSTNATKFTIPYTLIDDKTINFEFTDASLKRMGRIFLFNWSNLSFL